MLTRQSYPALYRDFQWRLPLSLNMAQQVLDHPADRVALIDPLQKTTTTFAELADMAARLAGLLLQQGVQPGDRVGVLRSQDAWCPAAHIAIWQIGAISVPLFKLFKQEALASRLTDSAAGWVITDEESAAALNGFDVTTIVPELEPMKSREGGFAETGPDDPAVLIYTSGTTGKPKGALHGHRVLTGHLPGVEMSHDFLGQDGDVLWTPADWAWIGGLFDVLMPGLALGVPVVAARMQKFSVHDCQSICEQANVRNVFFPPTALRMLKAQDARISGLRTVASGGEPLGAEMLAWGQKAFGVAINEFYGQTECNMVASSCGALFKAQPGCIGKAVPGHDVQVIDALGQPTDEEGDVAVRRGSASMMLRYWNNPKATEAKFRGDWLVTGDRGRWDQDFLRFIGREDDVITSGGYRIGPAEIEDCLLTHSAVATVGVVGKPDPLRTEIVKAYVVLKSGVEVDVETLQEWVKERLSSYSYPREICFLDALPMTVTGKVIRKELKARAVAE